MNQGKLGVVKQEMARMNIDIVGISELKWTGMGEFNSDDHYIYYSAPPPLMPLPGSPIHYNCPDPTQTPFFCLAGPCLPLAESVSSGQTCFLDMLYKWMQMPAQSSCVALMTSNTTEALPGPFSVQGTNLQGQALQRPPGP